MLSNIDYFSKPMHYGPTGSPWVLSNPSSLTESVGSAVRVPIAVLSQINSRAEQNPALPNSLLVFVVQAVTDKGSMANTCQGDVAM